MTTPAFAADTYATMPSGVSYHDEVVGTGPEPQAGQTVRVQYTGWLDDNGQKGAKFDSSRDRNEPFSFILGAGQVIAGWDSGVATMHVGGQAHADHSAGAGLRRARRRRRNPAQRHADLRRGTTGRSIEGFADRRRPKPVHFGLLAGVAYEFRSFVAM